MEIGVGQFPRNCIVTAATFPGERSKKLKSDESSSMKETVRKEYREKSAENAIARWAGRQVDVRAVLDNK